MADKSKVIWIPQGKRRVISIAVNLEKTAKPRKRR